MTVQRQLLPEAVGLSHVSQGSEFEVAEPRLPGPRRAAPVAIQPNHNPRARSGPPNPEIIAMNFQQLLQQREALQREARLANLAYAYERLGIYGSRIAQAGLRGAATLRLADPDAEQPWPALIALNGSQAVIEEHFTEEDIAEFADIVAFLTEDDRRVIVFDWEELTARLQAELRAELEAHGAAPGDGVPAPEDSNRLSR